MALSFLWTPTNIKFNQKKQDFHTKFAFQCNGDIFKIHHKNQKHVDNEILYQSIIKKNYKDYKYYQNFTSISNYGYLDDFSYIILNKLSQTIQNSSTIRKNNCQQIVTKIHIVLKQYKKDNYNLKKCQNQKYQNQINQFLVILFLNIIRPIYQALQQLKYLFNIKLVQQNNKQFKSIIQSFLTQKKLKDHNKEKLNINQEKAPKKYKKQQNIHANLAIPNLIQSKKPKYTNQNKISQFIDSFIKKLSDNKDNSQKAQKSYQNTSTSNSLNNTLDQSSNVNSSAFHISHSQLDYSNNRDEDSEDQDEDKKNNGNTNKYSGQEGSTNLSQDFNEDKNKNKKDKETPNKNQQQTGFSQLSLYLEARLSRFIQILQNNRYDQKASNNPVNKRKQNPEYSGIFLNNDNYLLNGQSNEKNTQIINKSLLQPRSFASMSTMSSLHSKDNLIQSSLKQQKQYKQKDKLQKNKNYLKKEKFSLKQKAQSKIFQTYKEIYMFVQTGVMSYYYRQLNFDLPDQTNYDKYLFPYCPDFDDYLYKEIDRNNEIFEFQLKSEEQINMNKQYKNVVQLNIRLEELYILMQLIIDEYKKYLNQTLPENFKKLPENQKNQKIITVNDKEKFCQQLLDSQTIYQFIDKLSFSEFQTQLMLFQLVQKIGNQYKKIELFKLKEKILEQLIVDFKRLVHTQLLDMVQHICLFNFIMSCQTIKICKIQAFNFKYYLNIYPNDKFTRSQIQDLSFIQQKVHFFFLTLNKKQLLKTIYTYKNQEMNQTNKKIIDNVDKKKYYQFSFRLFYQHIYFKDEDVYIQIETLNNQNPVFNDQKEKKIYPKSILVSSIIRYQCCLGQFIYTIIQAYSDSKNQFLQATFNVVRFFLMNFLTFLYYSLLQRIQMECKIRYGRLFYSVLMEDKRKYKKFNALMEKFQHIQKNSYQKLSKYINLLSPQAKQQQINKSSNAKKFYRLIRDQKNLKIIELLVANNAQKKKLYHNTTQFFKEYPKNEFIYKRMKTANAKQQTFKQIIENINTHYNFETNEKDYFYLPDRQKQIIHNKPLQIYECLINIYKDQLLSLRNMERYFDKQVEKINTNKKTLVAATEFNRRFQSNLVIILEMFAMVTMIPFYTFQTQKQNIKYQYFLKKEQRQKLQQTRNLKYLLKNLDQLYILNGKKVDHEYLSKTSTAYINLLLQKYQYTILLIENLFIGDYRYYLEKNRSNYKKDSVLIQKQYSQLNKNKNLIFPFKASKDKGEELKLFKAQKDKDTRPKLFKRQLHPYQVMEKNVRFWSIFNSHQTQKIIKIVSQLTQTKSSETFFNKQLIQNICYRFRVNYFISSHGYKINDNQVMKQFRLPTVNQKLLHYIQLNNKYEYDIKNYIENTRERFIKFKYDQKRKNN